MTPEKIKAIAEGMELECRITDVTTAGSEHIVISNRGFWHEFNPYTDWRHTGMVLDWLHKEYCYQSDIAKEPNGCDVNYVVDLFNPKTSGYAYTAKGSTLQEAICEAAYQVIKGERYE